jgi:hypothetical protein
MSSIDLPQTSYAADYELGGKSGGIFEVNIQLPFPGFRPKLTSHCYGDGFAFLAILKVYSPKGQAKKWRYGKIVDGGDRPATVWMVAEISGATGGSHVEDEKAACALPRRRDGCRS